MAGSDVAFMDINDSLYLLILVMLYFFLIEMVFTALFISTSFLRISTQLKLLVMIIT